MSAADSVSFWSDIKDLEDRLSANPDSFCFARLSSIYLDVGLLEDALHVARQGVKRHPSYLAGLRALAYACHAKGFDAEAIAPLRLLASALPEDLPSLKLFGRLLNDAGEHTGAMQAFNTLLEFDPDDAECRIEVESLKRLAAFQPEVAEEIPDSAIGADVEDFAMTVDLERLSEPPPVGCTVPLEAAVEADQSDELDELEEASHVDFDPLSTATIAELYVSQGFVEKALGIYHALLSDDPYNTSLAARVAALEGEGAPPATEEQEPEQICYEATADEPLTLFQSTAADSIRILEGWLENINKIRCSRSLL